MIRHDEQLFAQLYLETRLSSARKDALLARIRQEAAAQPKKQDAARRDWDFFRTAAAATCIAAVGFSIYLLCEPLPATETGSSIESLLEEVCSDTDPTTETSAETTAAQTDVLWTSDATETIIPGEAATDPAETGQAQGTTTAQTDSDVTVPPQSQSETAVTTTTESRTTAASAAPATTAPDAEPPAGNTEPPVQEAINAFCIESVTCGAGETVTLRLLAAKEVPIAGTVLYLDISDETDDCAPPEYVSMTPVWLAGEGRKYSWNPPTMALAPAVSISSAVPQQACLLELTVQIPQNIPSGTVYTVYMSQYQSAENGGKLLCEPYVLGTVTVQ